MAHDVFISHATEDKAIADAVCARLEQQGIRCWMAPRDIRPGADWGASIVQGIHDAQALILIFSASANLSREIPREISQAAKRGLSILTFRIEDVAPVGSLDYNLSTFHWLDALTPPIERHIESLTDTLRSLLQPTAKAPERPRSSLRTYLREFAMLAPVFAATSAPLVFAGMPFDAKFFRSSAAFYGLLLSILLLRRWQEHVLTAIVAAFTYATAVNIYRSLSDRTGSSEVGYVLAGVFGAVVMWIAVAIWAPRLLKGIPFAVGAGAVGGFSFLLRDLLLAHVLWQTAVAWTLLLYARKVFGAARLSHEFRWRNLYTLAALSVSWIPLAFALNSRFGEPLSPGISQTNAKDGLEYRWIPPGKFQMGCSPDDDDCFSDELPSHEVEISHGFWLGALEVTVEAWRKVMPQMPPDPIFLTTNFNPGWTNPKMPIVNVDWAGAQAYCTAVDGRLPSEAEWEYAARAGASQARYARLQDVAWYANNSGKAMLDAAAVPQEKYHEQVAAAGGRPHDAEEFRSSNAWNLYNMLGNVAEWVADDYGDQTYASRSSSSPVDPLHRSGSSEMTRKVARGGSWFATSRSVRASARARYDSTYVGPEVGFRCVWNRTP